MTLLLENCGSLIFPDSSDQISKCKDPVLIFVSLWILPILGWLYTVYVGLQMRGHSFRHKNLIIVFPNYIKCIHIFNKLLLNTSLLSLLISFSLDIFDKYVTKSCVLG